MRRRGTTSLLAGLGAAGAAIAVTTMAVIGSAGTTQGAKGSGNGDAVLLSAMQRDLSLSADQSSARLKKEAWAGGTERTLRQELGHDFAGAWMSKDGLELTVGVTTDAAADTVRQAGATPKLVARSESQLTALKKRLDSTSVSDSAVTAWYVDPPTNRLVVVTRAGDTNAALKLAAARGVPTDAVRVVTTKAAPRLLFDVQGGDAYFIDNQFRCSVGFAVVGGFVTAGHCGGVGSTTTGFNQVAQGTFEASQFPGTGDFSFVKVNGDWTPQPVVATTGGLVSVAGSQEAPIGASVCRTGSTTGTHCGVIQAKNATVNYPEGTVTGLTQTDVCAEGGDSGGPWLSGDQGQGVTSGGSGDCTVGGTTFFQPLTEILAVDKVQLVTTTDPDPSATTEPPATTDPAATDPAATDPPATDPPASTEPPASADPSTDCPAADTSLAGELQRTGSRQVKPSVGFFRAHSGTHHACLSAPADTDFSLSLQRWTGRQWHTVAEASDGSTTQQLTFTGRAGLYRYTVSSTQGAGEYVLGIDVP